MFKTIYIPFAITFLSWYTSIIVIECDCKLWFKKKKFIYVELLRCSIVYLMWIKAHTNILCYLKLKNCKLSEFYFFFDQQYFSKLFIYWSVYFQAIHAYIFYIIFYHLHIFLSARNFSIKIIISFTCFNYLLLSFFNLN